MQTYNVINNELTGAELPGKIYENLQSLKSEFSGTSFPTENLVAGMTCYRTDEGKVYRLMPDLNTWEIENNFSGLWEGNEQVKVGDVRYLSDRKYAGYVLECIQAGTTGNAEPVVSDSDVDNATDLESFSGTLQIVHGGHGATTVEGARANLGLGSVATENIVPVIKGGTGAASVAGARNALGLGNTDGALPIANGGTGATTVENARANLGLTYATQAEAEAGVSNTTVMTPLRTKNVIDKERPIKTYTSLEQLGLDPSTATEYDVLLKMEDASVLVLLYYVNDYPKFELQKYSKEDGSLIITRSANFARNQFVFKGTDTKTIFFGDWWNGNTKYYKLATNGALSMPSGQSIDIACELDVWWNTYYAPADGWVSVIRAGGGNLGDVIVSNNTKGVKMRAPSNVTEASAYVPCSKGDKILIYIGTAQPQSVCFIYAQSEV